MAITVLLDMANVVFFAGTLLLIYSIVKDRRVLHGFNPLGSILTLAAVSLVEVYYVSISLWISMVLSIPTIAMWFLASIYSSLKLRKK